MVSRLRPVSGWRAVGFPWLPLSGRRGLRCLASDEVGPMWEQHDRQSYSGREGEHAPSRFRPVEVTVDERGVESALRLFKRLVLKDGILRELY